MSDSIPELFPIPNWPHYFATCDGQIWSDFIWPPHKSVHRLKPKKEKSGHLIVSLRRDGKTHYARVHRLILETFIGPCPSGFECRHYPDQNPSNNSIENLSWASRLINQRDRKSNNTDPRGERHGRSTVTEQQVLDIALSSEPRRSLAARIGCSVGVVDNIRYGRHWTWLTGIHR